MKFVNISSSKADTFFHKGVIKMKLIVPVSAVLAVLLAGCQAMPAMSPPAADSKAPAATTASASKSAPAATTSGGSTAGAANALGALSGALGSLGSAVPSAAGGDKTSNILGAASDLAKAGSVTDEEVRLMASNFAKQSDGENKIAPSSSIYAKRLTKLTSKLVTYDGMKLDYKVYMSDTVNAFAMADGTVRVYSGLMDLMSDDELRFVLGHEIGHVKLGHSASSIKTAYQSSAFIKGASAAAANSKTGSAVMNLGGDQLKAVVGKAITSAHSRGQESDSDAYSVKFMKANKIPTKAASSALLKLAKGGSSGSSFLSTHPDPADRAAAVEKMAGN
jgi:metalloprotease